MSIKDIFYSVIDEASRGSVNISGEDFLIGFNTTINNKSYYNDSNLSNLVISSEEEFFKYLELYIDKEIKLDRKRPRYIDNKDDIIKLLISYLFVNASNDDFVNSVNYLKKRIDFLVDNISNKSIYLGRVFSPKIDSDIVLNINKEMQDVRMETPYRLDFSLCSGDLKYNLPSISYGISNNTCYIYSIQSRENKASNNMDEDYIKKIKRYLYKIDSGIDKEDDISLVSASFVLSLTIFINLLKSKGINKSRVILYLPVRYLARDMASSLVNDSNKSKMLLERNDFIQSNLTNKLLNTVRRVCYNLEGVTISNDITIDNGYVDILLDGSLNKSNNILLDNIGSKIR